MFKKDAYGWGIFLGILSPIISIVVYYYWQFYPTYNWKDFFQLLSSSGPQLTSLSVPFLLLNIILFTVYINLKIDKTAKGIFIVTVLIALTTLLVKFLY